MQKLPLTNLCTRITFVYRCSEIGRPFPLSTDIGRCYGRNNLFLMPRAAKGLSVLVEGRVSVTNEGNGLGFFPYLFALVLSGGSLLTYLVGAVVSRYGLAEDGRTAKAFNLSLPQTQNPETLFAVSLAAAQTTFSTVFVAFLTGAASLGLHLLYCPFAFAVGNWFMLVVYKRIDAMGYIDGSSISGLIPFFVYRLSGSRFISLCVAAICVLPIVAILALELYYGIPALDHLGQRAFPFISFNDLRPIYAKLFSLGLFACFMTLLLGYVFVGGFRAVVTSDVWQYRIMATTLFLILLSLLAKVLGARHTLSWDTLWTFKQPHRNLVAFYAWVTIVDFFSPLCFATTWQRFRAFRDRSTDFSVAVRRAIVMVVCLWLMLIFIGIGLQLVSPAPQQAVSPAPQEPVTQLLPDLLDRVGGINVVWFPLFVFPLAVVAGFSGMYSSSDTCVSALLYLTETNRSWYPPMRQGDAPLRRHYYWVMAAIFSFTFLVYLLYRLVPTGLSPVGIALSVFGNTVVLAPTILLLTKMKACSSERDSRIRSAYIGTSVVLGFLTYWLFWLYGLFTKDYPVPAVVAGLIAAAVPAYLLLSRERRATALERIEANA